MSTYKELERERIAESIDREAWKLDALPIGLHIPKESRGDRWLRAHWLLSVWKEELRKCPDSVIARENVEFLENTLPRLPRHAVEPDWR